MNQHHKKSLKLKNGKDAKIGPKNRLLDLNNLNQCVSGCILANDIEGAVEMIAIYQETVSFIEKLNLKIFNRLFPESITLE